MYNHASMNKVYRVVWNASLGVWQAVGELGSSAGKGTSDRRKARHLLRGLAGSLVLLSSSVFAASLPQNGTVTLGSGSLSQSSANTLNITQSSQKLAIDWQSFSIGQGNSVNFIQPSSSAIALNRVVGSDVSSIQGAINANGQVFLINPNGVLFSTTAQVNVGGLVASTRNITNDNFAAGKFNFEGTNSNAIINQGNIKTADGGYVVMIAAKIDNMGSITAKQGLVGMASGDSVTLDMGGPVKLKVNVGTLNSLISNGGAINADAGHILLSAKAAGDLAASVINNTGIIEAKSLTTNAAGKIELQGDLVSHTGSLDASAVQGVGGNISINAGLLIDSGKTSVSGSQGGGTISQTAHDIQQASSAQLNADGGTGKGGKIAITGGASTGGQAYLSGKMSAKATQGGQIHATANSITLAGANLDTSGTSQAGEQLIGGGWQGNDARIANAQTTNVSNTTSLSNQGENGTVVVWSDNQTTFNGSINATGSAVEVSGKENLSAYIGNIKAKSLLLDPKNIEIKVAAAGLNVTTIANPNNTSGDGFGTSVTELSNGNLVITAFNSDLISDATTLSNVGRVYLYKTDGELISTLSGSTANNSVGNLGVTTLSNGNYVVLSPFWEQNSTDSNAGAVTWGNGSTGVSGVVSASNSLVGSRANDCVGGTGVTALTNGNYVVRSSLWDKDSTATNAGAVTWGNGNTGVSGVVSETNSLVGSTANDGVGSKGVTALTNGNYVVISPNWDNGTFLNAGAVTWSNGTTGISGTVDANNSLVGNSQFADEVGIGGVLALTNGHYVVSSYGWDLKGSDGIASIGNVGAATWGNGNTGITGTIDATNSLVGSATADSVGAQLTELSNGHYVVRSSAWGNDAAAYDVGAVTWANGSGGTVGVVSSANSLVGSTTSDGVGSSIVTLSNGNFVVISANWDNTGATNAGAVTWVDGSLNGTMGRSGAVSSSNSLVGSTANDSVGMGNVGVVTLSNGNFVVRSSFWNSLAGAVTWVNGNTGLTGTVSASNSLVGTTSGDQVGNFSVTALTNGNYVVNSPGWSNGSISYTGAVTWGNGTSGVTGTIDANNSLVGSKANDQVGTGGVTALTNGNYVVASRLWDSDSAVDVGAVTWVDGSGNTTTGVGSRIGLVSESNSLVGSTLGDSVGSFGVIALSNGNYVTRTNNWDNVGATNAGAVTWGNGTAGTVGTVSASNSLVGSVANDNVGNGGIKALSNGNYVVGSTKWDNGSTASDAGAVTWGNGATGVKGTIDATNSLVGSTASDSVGSLPAIELSNGNYIVVSRTWDNGLLNSAGAVTWGNGGTGITGAISASNSIVGNRANAQLGGSNAVNVKVLSNGYFSVADTGDTQGGKVYISNGGGGTGTGDAVSSATFANNPSGNSIITPDSITTLLNAGTAVTLQANNDITVTEAITADNTSGNGGTFKLQAGRNISINNVVTTDNGDFIAVAGATGADANNKDAGSPTITLGSAGAINAGTGKINLVALGSGASFVNNSSVATPLQAAIASIFLPTYNVTGNTYFTKGNLSTTGKLYNTSYNETTDTGSCGFAGCVMPTSGINVFYAATPTISVTPTTGQTSTYGNSFTPSGSALSGFVDGDTEQTAGISGTASFKILSDNVSTSGHYVIGSHDIAYSDGFISSLGYVFKDAGSQTAELSITKKDISINGFTAVNKTYDGTTTAKVLAESVAFTGTISGDKITLGGNIAGSFVNKNAADGKTVNITGIGLDGVDAANYNLTNTTATTTANISKASISAVTGITANNKTYDGNTSATLVTTSAGFTDMVQGDNLSVATATGSFSDKNAADGKTVNITGISLSGTDAGNYTLASDTASTTANISKASISAVTGISASNKVYDATTTASLTTSNAGFTGMVTGDNLSVADATGNFSDKNAADSKTVNITGITLAGTDASNYTLASSTASTTANISKKDISITGLSASNKVYDGTTNANLTGSAIVTAIEGDTVSVTGTAVGSFADKNAGTGKTVNVTGLSLSGADADNYSVGALSSTADITKADLVVTGLTANSKVYDATSTASLTGTARVTALANDSVSLVGTAVGRFSDKNVGTGKTVTVTGNTLTGADADNYNLVQATGLAADITKANLTVTGLSATDKVYDGNTSIGLTGTATVSALANDSVSVSGAAIASVADKNVGTAKAVTVTGNMLTGADAANYNLIQQTGLTADISKKALSITGITASDKVYDANTLANLTGTASLTGVVSTDSVRLNGTAVGSFVDKNVGTGKTVNVTGLSLSGADADNYSVGALSSKADITKASISAVTNIVANNKTYDGNRSAMLVTTSAGFTGMVTGDSLSVATATGNFSDKNAADGKTVNVTGITLGGTDAGNYTLASNTASTTADITKASISAVTGITASNKFYDGSTSASLNKDSVQFNGMVKGDSLSVADATGAFMDKNAADGKTVNVTGISLAGTDAGNYTLASDTASTTANISKASISGVTGITANNKTYDGNATATLVTNTAGFTGMVSGDNLTVATATGNFSDKNAGEGKVVNITDFTLGGTDAGNYILANSPVSTTADITRLNSVTWVGPTTGGNWFDPANWAGGAVPDLSNVANVVLPSDVIVSFNTTNVTAPANASQAVNIDSLMGANDAVGGNLTQTNGSLVVGTGGINLTELTQNGGSINSMGNITAADLAQTNGSLSTTGNLTVSNSFSQSSAGVITVGGNSNITDLTDGVVLGNLNTTGTTQVISRGGNITQNAGTSIVSVGTSSWVAQSSANPATDYDVTLANADNDFVGTVSATGKDINITDKNALNAAVTSIGNSGMSAGGDLVVSGSSTGNLVTNSTGTTRFGATSVGGNLAITSTGDVTQTGALTVAGTTALTAEDKDVTLDNTANQFDGAMSFVAKDVVIGASKIVTVATRDVNSLRFVGKAEATAADVARGSAAQIPVQPVGIDPTGIASVFVATTPIVGDDAANVGTNGVSGGLVFVEVADTPSTHSDDVNNNAKSSTTNSGTSGIDASGFMRVSVVNGGINTGSDNNE
ncbi:MAG: filamentous hemagglutinin N-terminal domain-containing protein [Thiotrichales bacterium]|nr:filamentous hemagglutinin N-terminal domain-containing protein [Thiotrichales bacterium]